MTNVAVLTVFYLAGCLVNALALFLCLWNLNSTPKVKGNTNWEAVRFAIAMSWLSVICVIVMLVVIKCRKL
jgi:cytochrome b561